MYFCLTSLVKIVIMCEFFCLWRWTEIGFSSSCQQFDGRGIDISLNFASDYASSSVMEEIKDESSVMETASEMEDVR